MVGVVVVVIVLVVVTVVVVVLVMIAEFGSSNCKCRRASLIFKKKNPAYERH